ncbi:unnamed protein product, partial [Didymodactylos carnosus]
NWYVPYPEPVRPQQQQPVTTDLPQQQQQISPVMPQQNARQDQLWYPPQQSFPLITYHQQAQPLTTNQQQQNLY